MAICFISDQRKVNCLQVLHTAFILSYLLMSMGSTADLPVQPLLMKQIHSLLVFSSFEIHPNYDNYVSGHV